jgi:hypothetical protein
MLNKHQIGETSLQMCNFVLFQSHENRNANIEGKFSVIAINLEMRMKLENRILNAMCQPVQL